MADASYQPKVYHRQGGDVLVGASSGAFDIEDGFSFYFDGSTFAVTAAQLKHALYDNVKTSTVGQGAVSTVFSVVNMANSVKTYIFSMTSTCTAGSAFLTSGPVVGQERIIIIRPGSCASGQVMISVSGCSLVNGFGFDNSRMLLTNSTNSAGIVRLICVKDGEWSVVGVSSTTAVTFT